MDTVTVSPIEQDIIIQPAGSSVVIQDTSAAVNIEPRELNVAIQPQENAVNVLTGATIINNYYTSGGKLTVEFGFGDFAGGSLLIGEITSGRVIINTVVEIDTAFNSGSFTIGKDSAQAILMAIADRSNAAGRYLVNNYIELTATDNYKIFFSGSPSQGSGKVYITFA